MTENSSNKKYCVGVDIGGTTVKLGLFNIEGEILEKWEIPTRKEDNGANIIPDVTTSIRDRLSSKKIAITEVQGIGMGVPGPVTDDGYVEVCVNLGWKDAYPARQMKNLLGRGAEDIRVEVGNDANVAALGEQWLGGAKGYNSVVMITLGTGVGGGIVYDGKIVAGSHGIGGEIGHITVNTEETLQCNCGNYGCLEQYASATGVVRVARRIVEREMANGNKITSVIVSKDLSAKDVFDAAKAGDVYATEAVEVLGRYLGLTLSFLTLTIDPESFVIGGGVSRAGKILTDVVEKYYHNYVKLSKKHAVVSLASLGNDAGICGAAKMVLD